MKYAFIVMATIYVVTFLGCSQENQKTETKKPVKVQHIPASDSKNKKEMVVEMRQQASPTPLAAKKTKPTNISNSVENVQTKPLSMEQLHQENEQLKKELKQVRAEAIRANKMRITLDLRLRDASAFIRKQAKTLEDMRINHDAAEKKRRHDARIEAEKLRKALKAVEQQKTQPAPTKPNNNKTENTQQNFKPAIQPSNHKNTVQKEAILEIEGKNSSTQPQKNQEKKSSAKTEKSMEE